MRRMGIGLGIGINRSNYAQGIFGAYQSRVIADGGVTEGGACVDAVSSLLQSASLLLIPSGYKSGKAYAEIPTNGNGDLTWTRASTAIRTNSTGLLESMATGVPRLSYLYGSCPALLLEPQRTNLALQSESFDNSSWTKTRCTISANSVVSPDGNTTADTLVEDTTATSSHPVSQGVTLTAAAQTFSVYAKTANRSWISLSLLSTTNASAFFNLSNGTVGTVGSAATASIVSVGNGWYRCVITATTAAGANTLGIYPASADATNVYTGNGTASIYIWGAQCEVGAYVTTPIPTTTASATRIADSFSRNNIYTNGLITSSGGTWFVEFVNNIPLGRDSGANGLFLGNASTGGTNTFVIGGFTAPTTNRMRIGKFVSGVYSQLYVTTTTTVKIAIKWDGTSADIFANGTKVVSATSFTATNMEFLGHDGTTEVQKFIQAMALYPSPLSDTDCTTLTTL